MEHTHADGKVSNIQHSQNVAMNPNYNATCGDGQGSNTRVLTPEKCCSPACEGKTNCTKPYSESSILY